jgi:GNAT superfamily N-acetyltransferase
VLDTAGRVERSERRYGGAAAVVVDQVETAPEHRRRGLGAPVMRTLQNAALEAGAQRAVLGATAEGRALYTALGWRTAAPLTGLLRRDDAKEERAGRSFLADKQG